MAILLHICKPSLFPIENQLTKKQSEKRDLCKQYDVIRDESRLWSRNPDPLESKCDYSIQGNVRFQSLSSDELQIKENCDKTFYTNKCGASTLFGWLSGRHPAVNDGAVPRQICFSSIRSFSPCSHCTDPILIWVQNCSGFYAYKLNGVPSCSSRYCTERIPGMFT